MADVVAVSEFTPVVVIGEELVVNDTGPVFVFADVDVIEEGLVEDVDWRMENKAIII